MTELEQAAEREQKIKELDSEIAKIKEMQLAAMKAKDNVLAKVWANELSKVKQERHQIDASNKYMRLSIFVQVAKTYLTKAQFEEAWDRVEKILEQPGLMQC